MSNYTNNKMVDDPNHVWNKLANLIPDHSEVLDVGCSSANFGAALMAQKGCQVDGIEPDETDAKIAVKKLRRLWTFNVEEPANLAQIKKKYDVIIFADVLEHLVRPAETLQHIRTLLKPDGRVVFSIPNMAHVSVRLALLAGTFTYTETGLLDKTHLHFYDQTTVRAMFKEAGMQLSDIDGVIYGYPDALIHKRLSELGFSAEESGMAILRDPNAAIFQFVGAASYGKIGSKKATSISPKMTVLSQDIQNLVDDLHEQQRESEKLNQDNQALRDRIVELTNSRQYRVGSAVVRPAHAAKTTIKRITTKKK